MSTRPAFSISALARASGLDRRTVTNRLDAAGVAPTGTNAGHPLYPLGPAWRSLLKDLIETTAQDQLTAELAAETRLDTEISDSKLAQKLAGLAEREEAEEQGALFIDGLIAGLVDLVDQLKAADLPERAIERAQELCDVQIESMLMRRGRLFAELKLDNPDA